MQEAKKQKWEYGKNSTMLKTNNDKTSIYVNFRLIWIFLENAEEVAV